MKKILATFIRRPVFTAMLMLTVVVFGLTAYPKIGVDQFPEVDMPVVTVTTILPGAAPASIERNVTEPLEEALNTLSGVSQLRSESLEGVSQILVTFTLETKIDVAAQDVRDRVQATLSKLPKEVQSPVVEKFDIGAAPIMTLALSGALPPQELTRLAKDVLKPALQRQAGVGSVDIVGGRAREISVVLDPERLRGYGLSVSDVSRAVKAQSVDMPGGRATQGGEERVVRLTSEVASVTELGALVLAAPSGAPVRLLDVAEVRDGAAEARSSSKFQQRDAVALVIRKQAGGNTVAVAASVRDSLVGLRALLPPGLAIDMVSDGSRYIRASIGAVNEDLVIGAALAVLIVLLFLRNARSTFVAAIALPVSVVGTFAVMHALGFTFNIVTMLALTLSIGLLIDDAIVVIENIVRHLESGKTPWEAAKEGTAEIGVAVLAVTLAIVAVFIPVAFMDGVIGQFFYQFGVTVAVAVLISYAVSMTLTPMLSSRLLRAHRAAEVVVTKRVWLRRAGAAASNAIEATLATVEAGYRRLLALVLSHRALSLVGALGVLVLTVFMAARLKFTFLPAQDNSQVMVTVELPIGAPITETERQVALLSRQIDDLPGVVSIFSVIGGGVKEEVHKGEITVNLVEIKHRAFTQEDFKARLRRDLRAGAGVTVGVQDVAAVAGGGNRSQQVQLNLRGADWTKVVAAAETVRAAMSTHAGFTDVDLTYRTGKPQLDVRIDRDRAAQLGVRAAELGDALRAFLGRDRFADFREGGDTYDVKLRLPEGALASPEQLGKLTLRAASGQLVEVRNFATIAPADGPVQIDRQNQQRQITMLANLTPGFSLNEAVQLLNTVAAQQISPEVEHDFEGNAKNLKDSTAAFASALLLGVLLLYIILAAQFESLVHPLTIMMSLPFSFIGAIMALLLSGQELSLFALIGIIMLMGLVVKNGILLVDFAQQERAAGKDTVTALLAAGALRLRPILMTTVAMIAGMVPVALAKGDGAETRVPMALVIIGGLVTSTALTLVVVPAMYAVIDGALHRLRRLVSRGDRHTAGAASVTDAPRASTIEPVRQT